MDPAKVMKCFGGSCPCRQACARYVALMQDPDGVPLGHAGFNVCEFTRSDRFIPLSTSRVHGTHGALPNVAAASANLGGTPSRRDSQI